MGALGSEPQRGTSVRSAPSTHRRPVGRRQRQTEELLALCGTGGVARAVDLAFEHFAAFGRDDGVVALLAVAVERPGVPDDVRRRFLELAATS
jgi:hypothetical protein